MSNATAQYSLVPVKLEQHDGLRGGSEEDEWGRRRRRSAFVRAASTMLQKEKEQDEDADYLPVTAKPASRKRRAQRGKARVARRGQAEATPGSDELQEGRVIAVLTELVSLTDALYTILPDYSEEDEGEDDETTAAAARHQRKKRRRTSACYFDDDGDADQATASEYVGSSAPQPLAPVYDDTEYDDEHKSQQLESFEYAYDDNDNDHNDGNEDESDLVARDEECAEEDEVLEASSNYGDSELPHEGNDHDHPSLFEDSGRLWEASDDHQVYVSRESLRMTEQQQQHSEDEGEEPDVDETNEAVQQSADHVDASGLGWITLKRERAHGDDDDMVVDVDEQASMLFLSWPLVAHDLLPASGSMPSMTSFDPLAMPAAVAWLDEQLMSEGSLSGLHHSDSPWQSFLAAPQPAMPAASLSCEEELMSDELLPNGAEASVSPRAVPEESCTIAESWWTTLFV